ncbi:hypothetical protein [Aestuariivita boseongensis]|uniref:hypothetical protein n=1 Tax=Aestuariivita boseongensis TaxID=1470562 RepID=UPI000680C583|nr:hypothetical protein [Aestuariivita boseongensis]
MIRALMFAALLGATSAAASERHVGYYYPAVTSTEVFDRVIRRPGSNRDVRIDFLTQLTQAQLSAPESPRYIFSAKGTASTELIVVALDDEIFRTIYRARAVMAQMTSNIRSSPLFQEEELQTVATFYDLLQMLEFDSLIITDGHSWTHRVEFRRD